MLIHELEATKSIVIGGAWSLLPSRCWSVQSSSWVDGFVSKLQIIFRPSIGEFFPFSCHRAQVRCSAARGSFFVES